MDAEKFEQTMKTLLDEYEKSGKNVDEFIREKLAASGSVPGGQDGAAVGKIPDKKSGDAVADSGNAALPECASGGSKGNSNGAPTVDNSAAAGTNPNPETARTASSAAEASASGGASIAAPSFIDISDIFESVRGKNKFYLGKDISLKHFNNIQRGCDFRLEGSGYGKMLMFLDTTVFGGGKEGFAFCEHGFLWHEFMGKKLHLLYSDLTYLSINEATLLYRTANASGKAYIGTVCCNLLMKVIRRLDLAAIEQSLKSPTPNVDYAISRFKRSDDYTGMYEFAQKILHGGGEGGINVEVAEKLLEAAAGNHKPAKVLLGKMKYKGELVAQDFKSAFEMLADSNDPEAMEMVASMYVSGNGAEQDFRAAIKIYGQLHSESSRKALEEILHAQQELLDKANDCLARKDGQAALENFLESYRRGCNKAGLFAAHVLYVGDGGVAADVVRALSMYVELPENELDALAYKNMGECFENGKFINRDYKKSLCCYLKAEAEGINDLTLKISDVAQKAGEIELAFSYLRKYVDNGGIDRAFDLAEMFEARNDPQAALKYYKLVADSDDARHMEAALTVAQKISGETAKLLELKEEKTADKINSLMRDALIYYKKAEPLHDGKINNAIAGYELRLGNAESAYENWLKAMEYGFDAAIENAFDGLSLQDIFDKSREYKAFYNIVERGANGKNFRCLIYLSLLKISEDKNANITTYWNDIIDLLKADENLQKIVFSDHGWWLLVDFDDKKIPNLFPLIHLLASGDSTGERQMQLADIVAACLPLVSGFEEYFHAHMSKSLMPEMLYWEAAIAGCDKAEDALDKFISTDSKQYLEFLADKYGSLQKNLEQDFDRELEALKKRLVLNNPLEALCSHSDKLSGGQIAFAATNLAAKGLTCMTVEALQSVADKQGKGKEFKEYRASFKDFIDQSTILKCAKKYLPEGFENGSFEQMFDDLSTAKENAVNELVQKHRVMLNAVAEYFDVRAKTCGTTPVEDAETLLRTIGDYFSCTHIIFGWKIGCLPGTSAQQQFITDKFPADREFWAINNDTVDFYYRSMPLATVADGIMNIAEELSSRCGIGTDICEIFSSSQCRFFNDDSFDSEILDADFKNTRWLVYKKSFKYTGKTSLEILKDCMSAYQLVHAVDPLVRKLQSGECSIEEASKNIRLRINTVSYAHDTCTATDESTFFSTPQQLFAMINDKDKIRKEYCRALFGIYQHEAEIGNVDAQYKFCRICEYLFDNDAKDKEKDKMSYLFHHWLSIAVKNQHPEAMYRAAILYADEGKANADVANADKALSLLELAAERGDPMALTGLGDIEYTNENFDKAVKFVERAAAKDCSKAFRWLAEFYKQAEDYNESIKWFARSAESGCVEDAYFLGDFYRSVFEYHDEIKAAKWFLVAAELGHHQGMYEIAQCYKSGHGTEKDVAAASRWLSVLEWALINTIIFVFVNYKELKQLDYAGALQNLETVEDALAEIENSRQDMSK